MYLNQKRLVPRWKEWQPLATQQQRLRSLVQVIGLNLGPLDMQGKIYGSKTSNLRFYYTLHVTAMSAPFYTSEKLESNSPKWKETDPSIWEGVESSSPCFVLRLWIHYTKENCDEVLKVFGIYLSGLVYLGPHLGALVLPVEPNSVIFLLPGGYYTTRKESSPMTKQWSAKVSCDQLRQSYSLSIVNRLTNTQKAITERQTVTETIKQKIMSGDYMTHDRSRSAALRKILNKNRPKANRNDLNRLLEETELAKYRVQTLENEKRRMLSRLSAAKGKLEALCDGNQVKESRTMESYRRLQKLVQKHKEWLAQHVQRRELQLHAKALLNFRIKQLISELHLIYPVEKNGGKFTICNVYLPDSEELHRADDLQLSVALGFVAHTAIMVSIFLQVPLRYPIVHVGSRSRIIDLISKFPDTEREFPLFCKGKDKLHFNYAVYLLNKNIAGLRWLCGLPTNDLRCTLSNLAGLLNLSGSEVPTFISPESSTREATPSVSIASPVRQRILTSTPRVPDGFSYSLDKGLNEIERRRFRSLGGSETLLCTGEEASSSKCLQNWEAYKNVKFSDDDFESAHGFFTEKTVSAIEETVRKISFGQEACDDCGETSNQLNETEEIVQTGNAVFEANELLSEISRMSASFKQTLEVQAQEEPETSINVENELPKEERISSQIPEVSSFAAAGNYQEPVEHVPDYTTKSGNIAAVGNVVVESSVDALQDDVANRAEALANMTSFNMFRSRLRSASLLGID